MRRAALPCLALVALVAQAGTAVAAWSPSGNGAGAAQARQMPAGNQPTANVANRDVTVSWTQSAFGDGTPVSGYVVKRYDTDGNVQTIGSGCSGTVSGLSCTESAVPGGAWKYSVTPKHGANWTGAESAQSATATVGTPNLSFTSSTTVTSLPTTLSGNISNYISGQTVTFKLDDPSTGTALTGSITPSPVPSNGNASVSVTIPNGTSNGSHTVYAIGSQGDTASAEITVSVAAARSYTTSAWTVSDRSSGTATDASDGYAAAGGPYGFNANFQSSFNTSKYLAFNYNAPLRTGFPTSTVKFNFDFLGYNAATGTATNACFYFDVRRVSTGAVLDTHGSASSPVACQNALAYKRTSTSLPEVTSTSIANDLQVRVYMTNDVGSYNFVDRATVTGEEGSTAFTLYRNSVVDTVTYGAPFTLPWSLSASDGTVYTSDAGWSTTFSASKYINLTFPAYTPSGASGISATFKHSYRSDTTTPSVPQTCWYFEVYNGASLIGTHGSSSVPVSCNSTSSYVTDTVSLPEVDTVAEANNAVIRIYMKNSQTNASKAKSSHELATLKVDYTG